MSAVIQLEHLCKYYDGFELREMTFPVKQGYITGLIGPNGAGKTSLIQMIMGMVHPDRGRISLFGEHSSGNETGIKERIGYVSDENYFYEHLTIKQMKQVIAPFYKNWNEQAFVQYLELFKLLPRKKIRDLSKGMKMKFSLAVALSHDAELLIMDEPTAGLDPVFRRELLDLLSGHIQDEKRSILFSTHNTTDLDRIADYIIFINDGRLVFNETKDDLPQRYVLVKGGRELLDRDVRGLFIGMRETAHGFEGLMADRAKGERYFAGMAMCETPTLEDIMYFTVKGASVHV